MNLHGLIDQQHDRGTAEGQLFFWNATTQRIEATDESEIKWDKDNIILIINGTTQTTRLLAGGVS
jgi:hypothetical protein